jgi:phosphotransferase system  glucose/maltose/N-acetylglucosamine-specific IIC component
MRRNALRGWFGAVIELLYRIIAVLIIAGLMHDATQVCIWAVLI